MVTSTNQHIISYFLKCCPKIRRFEKIKENRINAVIADKFLSENSLKKVVYLCVKIKTHEKSGIGIGKDKIKGGNT